MELFFAVTFTMSFRALNREFDEVVIIDLLPPLERTQWRISEDLRDWLAVRGVDQVQVRCFTKRHVFDALDWTFTVSAQPTTSPEKTSAVTL